MRSRAITTATPCAALRTSLPGRGRRQISVFWGKTSGRRARGRVFRDVSVEDATQEEKKRISFIFWPAASSTRRLRAAADWGQLAHVFPENAWRVLPLELSWQHTRQRSAPRARAPPRRSRCHSTEHSEGVPLLSRPVLSGRRPRRGAWHINFACVGRGGPRPAGPSPALSACHFRPPTSIFL